MELDDTLKIQINKYLTGELSEADVTNFEVLLQKDEALRQQVAFYKDLDDTLSATAKSEKDFDKIADLLDNLGNEYIVANSSDNEVVKQNTTIETKKPQASIIRYLFPIAAAAAAFFLLPMLFTGDVSPQELANKNYKVYEANFSTKNTVTDLSKAEQLYNNKQWAVARDLFMKYPNNTKAQITKGNCEYQLQKYDDAIATLLPIAAANNDYSESASWYLALSYLQKDDKAKAFDALENITNGSSYYNKAQKLLKKL